MNITHTVVLSAVLGIVPLLAPATAAAQVGSVSRLGPTVAMWSAATIGSDIAFDPKNNVYLVVSAYGTVIGRFLSADGEPLGVPFVIQSNGNRFTFCPRAAFSPDAAGGAGGFLVTWHASAGEGQGTDLYSRIVSHTQGLGTETLLASANSKWTLGAPAAYASKSKEFLVVWQTASSTPSENFHVRGARVNSTGNLLGTVPVAVTAAGERDPTVAYNPTSDEFYVLYTGWNNSYAFVRGQLVKPGTGALIGAATEIGASSATYITDVAYHPGTNRYLASWTQTGGLFALMVNADGTPSGNTKLLSTRYATYDSLGLAYNPISGSFVAVSQDTISAENGGVEINGDATPLTSGVQLTASGGKGNFFPRVASHLTRSEWALATSRDYNTTMAQRFGTTTRIGGPPPPPPPPACTVALARSGTAFNSFIGGETFTVTASTSNCPWAAVSNAPWLTITSGAARVGTSTVSYAVAANITPLSRVGTITIAGVTYTVVQDGRSPVFDINADANADILWHNSASGHLAVWRMQGLSVASGEMLLENETLSPAWKVAGTADLNGDRATDILWQHDNGDVAYWLLRGTSLLKGGFIAHGVDTAWRIVATADMNNDSSQDIIWQHQDGTVSVWYMNGVAVQAGEVVTRLDDANWRVVGARDFNQDGHTDFVWHHATNGRVGIWLMKNGALLSGLPAGLQVADLNWQISGLADFNGDGNIDLLWHNRATGALAAWLMKGAEYVDGVGVSGDTPNTHWRVAGPR